MEPTLRPVPHQMSDPELVTFESCNAPEWVRLVANDLDGTRQASLEIRRADVTSVAWFMKVLRHWLAWRHYAIRLKILKSG